MFLLFVQSCLIVAAFCIQTSLVRDNVEDIQLAETQAEDAEEEVIVRVNAGIEGAAPIYWTSSEEASGLLTQAPQRPQNKSVGARIPAQFVQYILIQVNTRNQLIFNIYGPLHIN